MEYKPVGTTVIVGVTTEWLKLGFARNNYPPATPLTGNTVNPKAILILQEQADRNGDTVVNATDAPSAVNGNTSWYPIAFTMHAKDS